MSQTDDSAPVDGDPAEPESAGSDGPVKETPTRGARKAAAKKAASTKARSRSTGSRAKSNGRGNASSGGRTTAKAATGGTRKRSSTRQRAAALDRGTATATEKAEPSEVVTVEVTEPSLTEQSATEQPAATSTEPPDTIDLTAPSPEAPAPASTADDNEGPVAGGPEHDAWLALDDADREQDPIQVVPDAPAPSTAPRWRGRWTIDRGDAEDVVEGVPGLGPDWAEGDQRADRPDEDRPASEDGTDLATLPPPPAAGTPPSPPAPSIGARLRPLRAALSDRAVRASAWGAGLVAGRRRRPEDVPAAPAHEPGSLDPAYLATLPPPPAFARKADPEPGDLAALERWSLPDWSVSGAVDGGEGTAVDLAVSGVNSDRAVITPAPAEPTTAPSSEPTTEPEPGPGPGPVEATPTTDPGTVLDTGIDVSPGGEADLDTEPPPAIPQPGWIRSRQARRREWRRVERARRHAARHSVRFPIFTRSILLWMVLFALTGMGTGGIAAVFWTHFNTEIAQLQDETKDFDRRSEAAEQRIESLRNEAVAEIENRMKELAPALAEPRTVQAGKLLSPYVWFVSTLDENGVASVGTAFSVASDSQSTWLLTSFNVVRAGTVRPAPPIRLRKDPEEVNAELVTWDAANDLALIRMDRPNQPILEWAPEDVQAKLVGNRLYVVTGFGGAGATLNSAMAIDQNSKGLLHDGRIGTAAQGGPIVTTDGKVVGIASLVYQPLGFNPGELHYAASIRRACDVLLTCTMEAHRVREPGG